MGTLKYALVLSPSSSGKPFPIEKLIPEIRQHTANMNVIMSQEIWNQFPEDYKVLGDQTNVVVYQKDPVYNPPFKNCWGVKHDGYILFTAEFVSPEKDTVVILDPATERLLDNFSCIHVLQVKDENEIAGPRPAPMGFIHDGNHEPQVSTHGLTYEFNYYVRETA